MAPAITYNKLRIIEKSLKKQLRKISISKTTFQKVHKIHSQNM